MADLTYNKTTHTLTGFGKTWTVRCGGEKYAALENKIYSVPPKSLMIGTDHISGAIHHEKYNQACYKDETGLGWFLWLGEGGLGIHPNTTITGTQGCIGIVSCCTRDLFDLLRERSDQSLSVQVE
ncbi:MAG: hypothetical protein OEZ41_07685 [Nitrospirota bacterium]|nr:hypothetical protein [Nitrospirota bacterium]MDH5699824.1 hypothetical protein [Nitrospirota bacterium]